MREYVLEQAMQHLRSRKMEVSVRRLADGEVELIGREPTLSAEAQTAELALSVSPNGQIAADVKCVEGNRCEQLILELAKAVEGQASIRKKEQYFVQPVRAGKVRANVR